ncbi:glycosyltransferase family 2 protein [Hyphomonas sp.]|uniref:glycosyltransferase family 2 protein n=1 Tax=Hyphomonas sp. TaxID=87 RepID=UPI00391974F1
MAADGSGHSENQRRHLSRALTELAPDARAAHRAAFGFDFAFPDLSARRMFPPGQRHGAAPLYAVAGIGALMVPDLAILAAGWSGLIVFAAILVFRAALYRMGTGMPAAPASDVAGSWPVYTLLIALKDEAETAAQLAEAIRALDYPADRLDVKLLIEQGDGQTRAALLAQDWPAGTQLLTVPPGLPRTKPRALNYGLGRAVGEFVVVYDAEDRPHPDQLKSAVSAFRAAGRELACVQAPLVGEGAPSWIGGQWALEYAVQFGRLLPAQARLGLPVMLGGTSNHFRRSALEAAGGWDAWNVTEDAELGLRLARSGHCVGMIRPPTLETPPDSLMVWINQRSRWLKGFIQTWLVLMRRPGKVARELGLRRFLALQLTLGAAILSALVHGPWALWLVWSWLDPELAIAPAFLVIATLSYMAGILMALLAPGRVDGRRVRLALSLPVYWPLQSLAMLRAIYGLARCPHFWAKTPHGAASQAGRYESETFGARSGSDVR